MLTNPSKLTILERFLRRNTGAYQGIYPGKHNTKLVRNFLTLQRGGI
jgi:hypothetical protein